jgi:transketolase
MADYIRREQLDNVPTRFGFGDALVALGERNANVVVLGGDITASVCTDRFRDVYPDRFFSIGIAEQNMATVSAGLALAGKIPFYSTYGVFAAGRAWDQIRTTVCYSNLGVKIGGAHGGISVGPDGATHQALEEITLMRCLPNMTVLVPADSEETYKATIASVEQVDGPCYIRFGREAVPQFTTPDDPFAVGKANVLKAGGDVAIIACGAMVWVALQAAYSLEEEDIHARVINLHTVKPIDEETIIAAAEETGAIVTAEEHQVMGGMGSTVVETLSKRCPIPVEMVGVRDRFGESGQPEELMAAFGLDEAAVAEAARVVLRRK